MLQRFEPLLPNYYKRDKALDAWNIQDGVEIVCEFVPTFSSIPGDEGRSLQPLKLAKLEEHRRKNSLQVKLLVSEKIVEELSTTNKNAPRVKRKSTLTSLKTEQTLQLSLGIKARTLHEQIVKKYNLIKSSTSTSQIEPKAFRLRLITNPDVLGVVYDSGRLCQPGDTVHEGDVFALEKGQPLKEGQLIVHFGLILGNDRSMKGGGGTMTSTVEVVVSGATRIADMKIMALKNTLHLNVNSGTIDPSV